MKKIFLSLFLLFSQTFTQNYTVGIPVRDTISVDLLMILTLDDLTICEYDSVYDSLNIRVHSNLIPYVTGLNFQVEITSMTGSVFSNISGTVQVGDIFPLPTPTESGLLTIYYPESDSPPGLLFELQGTPLVAGESYFCKLFLSKAIAPCYSDFIITYNPDSICTVQPSALSNEDIEEIPEKYGLKQNFPNPFNPTTTIEFSIPQGGMVTLSIYDVLGMKVETILNGTMDAGHHKLHWNASNVPSGIYFVRMRSGDFRQVRKCTLVR